MRLKNTTEIPTTLLREVVRFTKPSSVKNFSIWFKNFCPGSNRLWFCGTAYHGRKHVVCRIPTYHRFDKPYLGSTHGAYMPWYAYTYEEALVALVAHELNHLAQAKNPRLARRTWNARGQFSERDCDAYAIRMMRAWRRREIAEKSP